MHNPCYFTVCLRVVFIILIINVKINNWITIFTSRYISVRKTAGCMLETRAQSSTEAIMIFFRIPSKPALESV